VKLVVDTNTIISGSLWQGPPARLISAALGGRAQIFLSLPMRLEFFAGIPIMSTAEALKLLGLS
jgi:predicted nucleic acid-binding protein